MRRTSPAAAFLVPPAAAERSSVTDRITRQPRRTVLLSYCPTIFSTPKHFRHRAYTPPVSTSVSAAVSRWLSGALVALLIPYTALAMQRSTRSIIKAGKEGVGEPAGPATSGERALYLLDGYLMHACPL